MEWMTDDHALRMTCGRRDLAGSQSGRTAGNDDVGVCVCVDLRDQVVLEFDSLRPALLNEGHAGNRCGDVGTPLEVASWG
jgi:hypothetical protein